MDSVKECVREVVSLTVIEPPAPLRRSRDRLMEVSVETVCVLVSVVVALPNSYDVESDFVGDLDSSSEADTEEEAERDASRVRDGIDSVAVLVIVALPVNVMEGSAERLGTDRESVIVMD